MTPTAEPHAGAIASLTPEECWDLVATTDLGRIALRDGDEIDIFPVNFLAKNGAIYFKSAPGSKLIELTLNGNAAFGADGVANRKRWSVLVHGRARRLDSDEEIEESGVRSLLTYSPTTKWNYVKIEPTGITGRRFSRRDR